MNLAVAIGVVLIGLVVVCQSSVVALQTLDKVESAAHPEAEAVANDDKAHVRVARQFGGFGGGYPGGYGGYGLPGGFGGGYGLPGGFGGGYRPGYTGGLYPGYGGGFGGGYYPGYHHHHPYGFGYGR